MLDNSNRKIFLRSLSTLVVNSHKETEGYIMPLNLADFNTKYRISKVCGQEKQRHYLESLGFVAGSEIELLSEIHGYYVVMVKGSKIGIEKTMAKKIILYAA